MGLSLIQNEPHVFTKLDEKRRTIHHFVPHYINNSVNLIKNEKHIQKTRLDHLVWNTCSTGFSLKGVVMGRR